MMKNFIRITALVTLALLLTACARGPVENKRAPGDPGEKTYEVLVNSRWITVSDQGWDNCELYEPYPACLTSSDR